MFGTIYKITNSVNDKVYIGKSTRPIIDRFKRHINDAYKNPESAYHLQRAIRKYGSDKFSIVQIDSANTRSELNEKEKYWISYYNSIVDGYNEASGGEGGNTYAGLSEERLNKIKKQISLKNSGINNGMSKQIKCKSIYTDNEYHFNTLTECLKFFNMKSKGFILSRVRKENKILWRNEWLFAFEDDIYINDYIVYDTSKRKGIETVLESDTEKLTFSSKNKAIEFLNSNKKDLEKDALKNGYKIYYNS